MDSVRAVLEDDLNRVEEALLERAASRYEFVDLAAQHVIEGGGKRLRPILLLLSAKSLGYSGADMYHLAAAMELIHVASLVHDDVIDEAAVRRSRETLNARFGNKVAVLVGDYLHARVLAILVRCRCPEPVLRVVADATRSMCEGEVVGAHRARDFDLALVEYLRIIELKTAKLMAASCAIGALVATNDDAKIAALTDYGHRIGLAFQIVDDMLDLVGQPSRFGKPTQTDVREGKLTLPVMYARDQATAEERGRLAALFRADARSPSDVEWIVSVAETYGGVEHAAEVAEGYSRQAKECLTMLPASRPRDALYELADYIVARDY
jgi:octaprenyl-diphosphate synthase